MSAESSIEAMNKDLFYKPIATLGDAKQLLSFLHENGLSYHCEDDANDCLEGLITTEEGNALNERMAEAYKLDFGNSCPCGFVLSLSKEKATYFVGNGSIFQKVDGGVKALYDEEERYQYGEFLADKDFSPDGLKVVEYEATDFSNADAYYQRQMTEEVAIESDES